MKLFQLTTFVTQADLDALQKRDHNTIYRVLEEMLEPANVEEFDDELTYSDDTRVNGTFDGEAE